MFSIQLLFFSTCLSSLHPLSLNCTKMGTIAIFSLKSKCYALVLCLPIDHSIQYYLGCSDQKKKKKKELPLESFQYWVTQFLNSGKHVWNPSFLNALFWILSLIHWYALWWPLCLLSLPSILTFCEQTVLLFRSLRKQNNLKHV